MARRDRGVELVAVFLLASLCSSSLRSCFSLSACPGIEDYIRFEVKDLLQSLMDRSRTRPMRLGGLLKTDMADGEASLMCPCARGDLGLVTSTRSARK